MALEYIEEGKKYKLELLCIHNKEKVIVFETPTGDHIPLRIADLECVSLENGIKNTDTAPKYDPCRKFREGDKVKAVLRHGRIPNDGVPKDAILEVVADERDGIVKVLHKMGVILEIFNVYALYLELVTPVEELEPYCVTESSDYWGVDADDLEVEAAIFWKKTHPHAKEAAEAECDRLNAVFREERSNG